MSSAPSARQIASDARWLVQALDPNAGLVRLVAMTPQDYRAASFLDDRLLQRPVTAHLVSWATVEQASAKVGRSDARWIFHIGHVGSTLVSRLLGELEGVLAIREPRTLRDLTFFPAGTRVRFVPAVQALMARTFAPGEIALVKATSVVGEIAAELVPPGERALFLFATPENYIGGILAGDKSREESALLGETRAARLRQRGIAFANSGRSPAHLAAAAWACEMTALEAASVAMPDRKPMWADFDRLLENIDGALAEIAGFFDWSPPKEVLAKIAAGPLMSRYSKAPEHDYSPALRRELLADAARANRADIDDSLAMLNRAAEKSPLLETALARAALET